MNDHAPPPQAILLQMLMGTWVAQAVGAAARLGIADTLRDGPQTSEDIAKAVGADTGAVQRTMRALAGLGVFASPAPDRWALTPVGECLRRDAQGSLRELAIAETDQVHWATWARFTECVRTGRPQAEAALGCLPWDYYASHPEEGAVFSRAMANISSMAIAPVLASYDFSAAEVVADVGGAFGALLAAVLRATPSARGVLFDRPDVVAGAGEILDAAGVGSRVERIGGDFLRQSMPSADLYLLKHILHDWDDDASVDILKNVRAGMKPTSRVLVIELLVPDGIGPGPAPLMDLNMMVALGGMERTADQYADLFARAGLRSTRVIPTPSPYAIVEGALA